MNNEEDLKAIERDYANSVYAECDAEDAAEEHVDIGLFDNCYEAVELAEIAKAEEEAILMDSIRDEGIVMDAKCRGHIDIGHHRMRSIQEMKPIDEVDMVLRTMAGTPLDAIIEANIPKKYKRTEYGICPCGGNYHVTMNSCKIRCQSCGQLKPRNEATNG